MHFFFIFKCSSAVFIEVFCRPDHIVHIICMKKKESSVFRPVIWFTGEVSATFTHRSCPLSRLIKARSHIYSGRIAGRKKKIQVARVVSLSSPERRQSSCLCLRAEAADAISSSLISLLTFSPVTVHSQAPAKPESLVNKPGVNAQLPCTARGCAPPPPTSTHNAFHRGIPRGPATPSDDVPSVLRIISH